MAFFDFKAVRARKPHRCQLCDFEIPKGDYYYRQSFPVDDGVWTYKAHVICDRIFTASEWFDPGEPTPTPADFISELLHYVVSAEKSEVVFR